MSSKQYFAYRSFLPQFETVGNFMKAGVNTICIFPANTMNSLGEPYCQYPPNWRWFDCYDFSGVDRQINDLLSINPRAEFLVMIDLNSPEWLSRQLSLRHDNGDSFTQLTQALCMPEWKTHTTNYLSHFLDYCESHYAEKIKAYILACGHTDEWLDHSGGAAGRFKAAAYRLWLNAHHTDGGVPDALELDQADFDGLLYDPALRTNHMNYWRFSNEVVADSILEFANEAVKHVGPETEIGVFYGYVMDRIGPAVSGHVEYERVFNSENIDFIISPGTYRDREIGGGSGFLTVSGSERLAGKRHMHECDQRTHTYNPALSDFVKLEFPCWPDTASDIAGMKREFALSLIEQNSLWWFDMWGGFYQEQELFDNLSVMKKLWDKYSEKSYDSVAEVALIVDPDSLYYMLQTSPRQADFSLHARKVLNQSGAPFDIFSMNDIPRLKELERYKLFIFSVPFEITSEKAELLKLYILNGNRSVIWFYAPGISNGTDLDLSRVQEWAGVDYGNADLNITNMGSWNSIYLHQPMDLTPAMLKNIAADAGVHIYCENEQPIYVNNRLLAIHTAVGGSQQISLPGPAQKVVELFSGTVAVENADTFMWNFNCPDTVLFEIITE